MRAPGREADPLEIARQLERMIGELETVPQEPMVARTRELARLLTELHGAGLARVLMVLRGSHPKALAELLDDDMVASLLVLHDLHPEPVRARVERALGRVGKMLKLRLTIVELRPERARVLVEGGPSRVGASALDTERMIRDAVHAMAPEVELVELEAPPDRSDLVQITWGRTPPPAPTASRAP